MSEENNQTPDKESKQQLTKEAPDNVLKIEIARDEEIERVREENKNLTLELAKKNWEDKNPYGRPKAQPYEGAPLNEFYCEKPRDNGDLLSREFESQEQMYSEINKIAHNPNHPQHKEAIAIEQSLLKKLFKDGIDHELVGSIDSNGNFSTKAWYRRPIEIRPEWTADQKQIATDHNTSLAKARQWRKVE